MIERLYGYPSDEEEPAERGLPPDAAPVVPGNAVRIIGRSLGGDVQQWACAAMFADAALVWLLAAIVSAVGLLRHDGVFRRFVTARTMLLVSALSPA